MRRWDREGILKAVRASVSHYRVYQKDDVQQLLGSLYDEVVDDEVSNYIEPENEYSVLELFAGAGGLAVGMEIAGLKCVTMNEIDKWACKTLRKNRPNWEVLEGDIRDFEYTLESAHRL